MSIYKQADRSSSTTAIFMADHSALYRAAPIVRCLITTMILFFIALSVGSMIAWLIMHPRAPEFHVKSLSVSNFTAAASYQVVFAVRNTNGRISMMFKYLDIAILYKQSKLSSIPVGRFPLRKKGRPEIKRVKLEGNGGHGAAEMGLGLRKEVVLSVRMSGWAMLRAGRWISKGTKVQVECKNMTVVFSGKFKNAARGELSNEGGAGCSSFFVEYASMSRGETSPSLEKYQEDERYISGKYR